MSEEARAPEVVAPSNPLWSHQTVVLVLCALSLVLITLPLAIGKPGLPTILKADEAAYVGMASSLAHDLDLRFEARDTTRLFREFPYRFIRNVIVMSGDGWQTVYYAKPWLYSAVAAPFVRLFGTNGMLLLNFTLLAAMIWMGALFLSRTVAPGVAALFSTGFVLLSTLWSYAFWLQPELFNAFLVMTAVFLVFDRAPRSRGEDAVLYGLSGACLAMAAHGKPMYSALALGVLGAPLLERRFRPAVVWCLGFLAALGLILGASLLLTGAPSPYAIPRQGVTLCVPGELPSEIALSRAAAARGAMPSTSTVAQAAPGDDELGSTSVTESATGNTFAWLIRIPNFRLGEVLENVWFFFVGRHAGLLPYHPFAGLAVVLFLLTGRSSRARWCLLGSLAAVALFLLVWIPWNWQGGGGFVGNRYFVSVVPAFLFLVPAFRARLVLVGFLLGGLLLGPLLLTPFSPSVPEPTLQAHTRSFPLRHLPLELSLKNMPGYYRESLDGVRVLGRRDQMLPRGDALWLQASSSVEVLFLAEREITEGFTFQLRSPAAPNRLELAMGREEVTLEITEPGQSARVTFEPAPTRARSHWGTPQWVYRLRLRADEGAVTPWTRHYPPTSCTHFATNDSQNESFWLGAELLWLGGAEVAEQVLWPAEWQGVEPGAGALRPVAGSQAEDPSEPPVDLLVTAGESFELEVTLRNSSGAIWPASGGARVHLSYHWEDAAGNTVVRDGERSMLPHAVSPGDSVDTSMELRAPDRPGRFMLVLDPVYEHIAWFSERDSDRSTLGLTVDVRSRDSR